MSLLTLFNNRYLKNFKKQHGYVINKLYKLLRATQAHSNIPSLFVFANFVKLQLL